MLTSRTTPDRPPIRAILQARLSSSRLPGKALLPIGGVPMVALAARRVGRLGIDAVVATSHEIEDDAIAEVVRRFGVRCVRGPLQDTLGRIALAADDLPDDALVVRLTGDNVMPDAELIMELVDRRAELGVDYIRTGGGEGDAPYGLAMEVFGVEILRRAERHATTGYDREHVTPWIRRESGDCWIDPAATRPRWRGRRATVDTLDDYERVRRAFSDSDDPIAPGWAELCERLPDRPPSLVRRENPLGQGSVVLGTVQLGLAYGITNTAGMPDETQARALLVSAAELGVTHLDTGRAYGRAEARIGRALRRGLSERTGVITKIAPLGLPADAAAGWATAAVEASFAESRRALQTDVVDAVLLHRAADAAAGGGVVMDRLAQWQADGSARLVGVSVQDPQELITALADTRCGYVQLPFNLLDHRWRSPRVTDAVAARPDVVVTARSVYLQGLLAAGPRAHWPVVAGFDEPAARRLHDRLTGLAAECGRDDVGALAVAYVLAHPWITSVVVGADTVDQLRRTVAVAADGALSADERDAVDATIEPVPETLLDPSRWPAPGSR